MLCAVGLGGMAGWERKQTRKESPLERGDREGKEQDSPYNINPAQSHRCQQETPRGCSVALYLAQCLARCFVWTQNMHSIYLVRFCDPPKSDCLFRVVRHRTRP